MTLLRKLDKKIEKILKPVPHLPASWRRLISENVWWVSMLGSIISAVVAFVNFVNLISSGIGLTLAWYIKTTLFVIFMTLIAITLALASSPLENFRKRGWDFAAIAFLSGIGMTFINMIFNVGTTLPSNLINFIISTAMGTYILYEIKSNFYKK